MRINIPKDLKASYEREIDSKAENKAKFFASLAFVTVVLFLIFGIKPLAVTTASNKKVLAELNAIEQELEKKLQEISTNTDKLELLSEQKDLLYRRVPQDIELEEYLEDLVLAAADSGFIVQRFRRQLDTPTSSTINIELTGNPNSLPKLISIIENTTRFATIKEVGTKFSKDITTISLLVQIYTL